MMSWLMVVVIDHGDTPSGVREAIPSLDRDRVDSDPMTFKAQFSNPFSDPNEPRFGHAVVATNDPHTVGVATVRTGSAGLGSPQLPQIVGLIVAPGTLGLDGGLVTVQESGQVVGTIAQWDRIAGTSGGLVAGLPYYLDWGFNSFGGLTSVPPPNAGMARVQVGVAINSTTLVLSLPAVPVIVA
jgi:hypothetical protein